MLVDSHSVAVEPEPVEAPAPAAALRPAPGREAPFGITIRELFQETELAGRGHHARRNRPPTYRVPFEHDRDKHVLCSIAVRAAPGPRLGRGDFVELVRTIDADGISLATTFGLAEVEVPATERSPMTTLRVARWQAGAVRVTDGMGMLKLALRASDTSPIRYYARETLRSAIEGAPPPRAEHLMMREAPTLAGRIPRRQAVYWADASPMGGAERLRPGDRVDLIAHGPRRWPEPVKLSTRVVAHDLEVLDVRAIPNGLLRMGVTVDAGELPRLAVVEHVGQLRVRPTAQKSAPSAGKQRLGGRGLRGPSTTDDRDSAPR